MPAERISDGSGKSTEILLADYRYLADSFWRNEEAGEKRVNFFISLVTAVLAALVALVTKRESLSDGQVGGITFAACLALLLVGVLTFRRLIRRNFVTDRYKVSMDHIRDVFRGRDPVGLANYDPFPKEAGGGGRSFGRGGLTDLVAAVNSVIAAVVLVAPVAVSASLVVTGLVAGAGFVLALAAHAAYLEHRYHGTWVHPLWGRLVSSSTGDRSSSSGPREIESTLVVVSETPEAIFHAIEGLREVAGYRLDDPRPERIHDRYLDNAERELMKRKIALRVRELDGRILLTLKGPSALGRWGGEDRGELELDWSEQAWKKIGAELDRHGVSVGAGPPPSAADALAALATAGFEIVQDREAQRRVRDVSVGSIGPARVAELALDAVTYHLSDRDIRHYEVEIEAKSGEGAEAVAAVTTALTGRYWPRLRPWHHGKLATGQAVAALVGDGRARDLVGRDGSLEPSAYDVIAEALERGTEADAAPVAAD